MRNGECRLVEWKSGGGREEQGINHPHAFRGRPAARDVPLPATALHKKKSPQCTMLLSGIFPHWRRRPSARVCADPHTHTHGRDEGEKEGGRGHRAHMRAGCCWDSACTHRLLSLHPQLLCNAADVCLLLEGSVAVREMWKRRGRRFPTGAVHAPRHVCRAFAHSAPASQDGLLAGPSMWLTLLSVWNRQICNARCRGHITRARNISPSACAFTRLPSRRVRIRRRVDGWMLLNVCCCC